MSKKCEYAKYKSKYALVNWFTENQNSVLVSCGYDDLERKWWAVYYTESTEGKQKESQDGLWGDVETEITHECFKPTIHVPNLILSLKSKYHITRKQ